MKKETKDLRRFEKFALAAFNEFKFDLNFKTIEHYLTSPKLIPWFKRLLKTPVSSWDERGCVRYIVENHCTRDGTPEVLLIKVKKTYYLQILIDDIGPSASQNALNVLKDASKSTAAYIDGHMRYLDVLNNPYFVVEFEFDEKYRSKED